MKLRGFMTVLAAAVLIAGQSMTASAAENTVISLDPGATAFTKVEKDLDFQNMEPGEERTATVVVTNDSDAEMNFYISGEIVYNIADSAGQDKNAVYYLSINKDQDAAPFFSGMIGSAENKKLNNPSLGLNYLQDDTKLASLKKGEQSTITITLKLDGDSTENVYMNKAGQMRLHIYTSQAAATVPATTQAQTVTVPATTGQVQADQNTVVQHIANVFTGDHSNVAVMVLIGVLAAVVIVLVLILSRKKEQDKDDSGQK